MHQQLVFFCFRLSMAEGLNIDFIPPKLYVSCSEPIINYSKKQVSYLWKLRRTWSYQNDDILLSHMIHIRFKNQLRHFLFFKSFCSVRRILTQICDGSVFFNGISNFINMSTKCPKGHHVSGHTLDHVLVCLIHLYKKIEVLLTRLISCWRSCNAQFTTGHFTKVLLLIMTVISSLRLQAINSLDEVNCCYENLFALRRSLTNFITWLPFNITLPPSLGHQRKASVADIERQNIDTEADEQVKNESTFSNCPSVTEIPHNSYKINKLSKPSTGKKEKVKRFSCDTQRSL
ncbi:unnamed protein product [Heterobilharzia americana]|nr:unnamed protein product [Heterobilharzia americana]